jgi:hypothetical protein
MATPRTGRPRGRPPKAKNKSTIEREKKIRLEIQAQMEREKAELAGKISAQGVTTIDDARALAAAQGPKLLKDIGAEFTRIFAGMAEYHRPRKGNKHGNATKFMEYARLAMQGAKECRSGHGIAGRARQRKSP